ncbi:HEAT repeat domain-containing protein [Streptomyces sp. NPDC006367]|uniref:HEAT repeat domain-containing protein n=1 Tax=unclassified Streptomyces TaxID=2593676 RepID=UPI0033BBE862
MSPQDARARRLARLAAQVDWSKVVDPYTTGRYGPEVLEELWSADRDTAGRVCENLRCAAVGDGGSVRAAAAETLPFLVEAARDPDVTVRSGILRAIADIAAVGDTAPDAWVDPAWPAVWERAADALLPLLDDGDVSVRSAAAAALSRSTAHADALIARFLHCFGTETDPWAAGQLVLGVGELARHATTRREEALVWLRHRMTDAGKGEEPDLDEDVDAWPAWTDDVRHDVRLEAVQALCRALPGHSDPAYARVTADALLAPSFGLAHPPVGSRSWGDCWDVDVITEADRRLGADLPGRLALAHALLRAPGALQREGGLRVAAGLMSRRRSAVPELLPSVAGLVDDARPENRALALRVLAMCGAAARPWAELVAARLAEAVEPHAPVRERAAWALSRMGDERCVPPLAELLAGPGAFTPGPARPRRRDWDDDDLSLTEALAPLAAHMDTLLDPLLTRIEETTSPFHPYCSVVRRWHEDGGDVVPRLLRLLDSDDRMPVAAHVLSHLDVGAVAAAHRERLRERLGLSYPRRDEDLAHLSPFGYHSLTGDDEPLRALLRPPDGSGLPGPGPGPGPQLSEPTLLHVCVTLGPLAASAADRLRGMFHEALSGKPHRRSDDAPRGAVERGRALWRVTGDADEVLPALLELTARSTHEVHRTPGGVEALELLAEVAAAHPPVADRVARRLRAGAEARIRHDNPFDAMRIVRALWQLTSDPHLVTPLLTGLVRICPPPGGTRPTVLEPLRLLAETAASDPASLAPAVPALRTLLDTDERPVRHDHWRAVSDDDALRAAARTALATAAATAEPAPGTTPPPGPQPGPGRPSH